MPEYKKAYTTIMVDDMDRAVDFYTRVLGLAEDFRFGDSWAEVTVQGHRIGIHPKKIGHATTGSSAGSHTGPSIGWLPEGQKTPPHAPAISIGFEVADIRKTAKELEAKGVQFHFQETDVTILAFFKDPDGTYLYLTQVR
jgi:catechol 2,3-dioxygenase-like lactoylglutathione lyase family enzyme